MILSQRKENPTYSLTFNERDVYNAIPQNEALVIEAHINNYLVRRLLVDDGSAVNLITWQTYQAMKGDKAILKQSTKPITGIGGSPITPLGLIYLEVELGDRETEVTVTTKVPFNVVDIPLSYNRIIGRPLLHDVEAVTCI